MTGAIRSVAVGTAMVLCALFGFGLTGAAAAQETPPTTAETTATTSAPSAEGRAPSVLPRPNSGVAPESATERGGAAQLAVFVGMIAAVGFIAFLAWRQSKAALAARDGGTSAAKTAQAPTPMKATTDETSASATLENR